MCSSIGYGGLGAVPSFPTRRSSDLAVLVHPAPAETKLTWAGSTSVTVPPLEVEGPLLVRSEERRVGKEGMAGCGALFVNERSATRRAVVVATEAMLAAVASSMGLVAVTVAVLAMGPVAAGVMWTTIVKGWVAMAASAPTVELTVPAVLVHPALAETKLTWAGSTSVTVPPLEVEGPLLVTRSEERRVGKEGSLAGAP